MGFIGDLEDFLDDAISKKNTSSLHEILQLANTTDVNETNQLLSRLKSDDVTGNTLLILAYSVLFLVSLFGNTIVCYVIFRNKRLHTVTNLFITNLAIADIMVTILNIPFTVARFLLDDWPFGIFLCQMVNFSLMTSVYVSTFTLTGIALDRHQVIMYPLRPRMGIVAAVIFIVLIWIIAVVFSLPYGIYTHVQVVKFFFRTAVRCRSEFPGSSKLFEQSLTVTTFTAQYIVPLVVIAVAYGRIVYRLWSRTMPGAVTQTQQITHEKAKRKSIKMLILVVTVFALCWMPLNLYHILTDVHPSASAFIYNSTAFFVCHWIAVSSTCYNPFIYCWLNEVFRREVKRRFHWCYARSSNIHPGVDVNGVYMRADNSHKSFSQLPASSTRTTSARREGAVIEDCPQSSNSGGESVATFCDNISKGGSPLIPRSKKDCFCHTSGNNSRTVFDMIQ